jgi:hypothetical protein
MAKRQIEEPRKKAGDVMESLIDRTGGRGAKPKGDDDDELDFERDPQDPDVDDSDDE